MYTFSTSDSASLFEETQPVALVDEVTLCAWVRPNSSAMSGHRAIISRGLVDDGKEKIWFGLDGGKLRVYLRDASTYGYAIGNTALTVDTLTFIALTYDGNLGSYTTKLYKDSGVIDFQNSAITGNLRTNDPGIAIGIDWKDAALTSSQLPFGGEIAECAEWSRALSPAEIGSLAKGFSPLFFLEDLNWYAPLLGNNDPEIDRVGGALLDHVGSGSLTKSTHPRIIRPSVLIVPGMGTGSNLSIPAIVSQNSNYLFY